MLEKTLSVADLKRNTSRGTLYCIAHCVGEVTVSIRVPSWRQKMETSPSFEGKTMIVTHVVLITVELTRLASLDIKLPIKLLPRKTE